MEQADKKKAKQPFRLQEHVEWIAMAFVLALTFRCFVVEAYQIPSGSMAPTLYGKHFTITCPACGETSVVRGNEAREYLVSFVCPVCGADNAFPSTSLSPHGGDRILVAKDLYLFTEPRRWDVFVFKSPQPDQASMNFVKRLVGLPGETVELRDGQVFIDGHIIRKPRRIQEELWQPVYGLHNAAFASSYWTSEGGWRVQDDGSLALADPGESWQTIEYTRAIKDFYPYNGRPGDNVVGDLLVRGHVNLEKSQASFSVGVYDDSDTFKAIFTPVDGRLEVQLRRNEELIRQVGSSIPSSHDFDFSLSVVDASEEVCINGISVIYNEAGRTPEEVPRYTNASGVFFGGFGTKALVSRVEIKRDVYYRLSPMRADRAIPTPYRKIVPPGCYLGFGDNSPISNDSRVWGEIPRDNILGKAFFVFWPPQRIEPVY